jgi:hypothetical protein
MKLSLGQQIGWSCCFSEANPSQVWIGGSAGMIMLFDIRRMGGRVLSPTCPLDSSCLAAYQLPTGTSSQQQAAMIPAGELEIPNLIPYLTLRGGTINPTYPPIQSLLHTAIPSPPSSSALAVPALFEHLLACQGGQCRFLALSHNSPLNALASSPLTLSHGTPASVYDIQRYHPPSSQTNTSSCHYLLACRTHLLSGQPHHGSAQTSPAFRRVSFDLSQQTQVPWKFEEGVTVTGHSLTASKTKPSSCNAGQQFTRSLMSEGSGEGEGTDDWGPDSGLMIASPDEVHQGVYVSIVCGQETRHLEV